MGGVARLDKKKARPEAGLLLTGNPVQQGD
jgi:hypothetical protein